MPGNWSCLRGHPAQVGGLGGAWLCVPACAPLLRCVFTCARKDRNACRTGDRCFPRPCHPWAAHEGGRHTEESYRCTGNLIPLSQRVPVSSAHYVASLELLTNSLIQIFFLICSLTAVISWRPLMIHPLISSPLIIKLVFNGDWRVFKGRQFGFDMLFQIHLCLICYGILLVFQEETLCCKTK